MRAGMEASLLLRRAALGLASWLLLCHLPSAPALRSCNASHCHFDLPPLGLFNITSYADRNLAAVEANVAQANGALANASAALPALVRLTSEIAAVSDSITNILGNMSSLTHELTDVKVESLKFEDELNRAEATLKAIVNCKTPIYQGTVPSINVPSGGSFDPASFACFNDSSSKGICGILECLESSLGCASGRSGPRRLRRGYCDFLDAERAAFVPAGPVHVPGFVCCLQGCMTALIRKYWTTKARPSCENLSPWAITETNALETPEQLCWRNCGYCDTSFYAQSTNFDLFNRLLQDPDKLSYPYQNPNTWAAHFC